MPKKDTELVRVTGLWKNTSKSGASYLGGQIKGESKDNLMGLLGACESVQVMIFSNKDKKNPKGPDFSMTVAPTRSRSQSKTSSDFDDDDAGEETPF